MSRRIPTFTLNLGPAGSCPDCDQQTFVRLGSLMGVPKKEKWVVSKELLAAIHQDIRSQIKDGGDYVPKVDPQTGAKVSGYKIQKQAVCRTCEAKASKLIWIALDGEVGAYPDALAGPFCSGCLKEQKRLFEHADGSTFNPLVYYVVVNAKLIEVLVASETRGRTSEAVSEETNELF